MIRNVELSDASAVCELYNYYVNHTTITFEENEMTPEEMEKKIIKITKHYPWFVYLEDNEVKGYVFATTWNAKSAYRFTVETSIYLHENCSGKGVGSLLYQTLFDELKNRGIHSAIGVLTVPNEPSERLHKKFGFKKVGHFDAVGYKFDKWIDVSYWQLIL